MKIKKSKFIIPPWHGDIERLIATEVLDQFVLYQGHFYDELDEQEIAIPIEFRYGHFALKHIRYRFKSKKVEMR